MAEISTPPIPEPIRATDSPQQRAHAPPRRPERRPRAPKPEIGTNEQDEPIDDNEQEHNVDISV